ncbi:MULTISPECIES: serine hydrolase [Pseudomonas]|uniref:serine hydrolase domain-containing protein n=1 Tax=Pseudomonas TaxID=286 RepID=UPI001C0A8BE6|nr:MULTISPECIES: serine hydrolase [Pseudomonas]MCK3840525.1 class C beta-lactamase-related serine hydrolase [Pseudomonas sp. NCIMB 10586]MCK3847146.1 class C beta-lactamase-related serine hydrolase [Pseudomonas sp. W15Feb34]VCU63128.1 hydrolase [Pseudomonas synxantha]
MQVKKDALQTLLGSATLSCSQAQADVQPQFLSADASDPQVIGWMQGSPPAPEKVVGFSSILQFPQTRWSFSHLRELLPSVQVARGKGAASPLPRAEREDIDALVFTPLGSDRTMTWEQSLKANYTDGILVLHRGQVVYERYFGALTDQGQHIAMSVTKSFIGTLGAMLVEEGSIDPQAKVSHYVLELKDSAFGDATVRQVMDMTVGVRYSEDYADPKAEIWEYLRAAHMTPRPEGYAGATTVTEYLMKLRKEGEHGQAFAYKTVNTDVLSWVIQRATGKPIAVNLQERIWSKLGAEQDAYLIVDEVGTAFTGGGFNTSLRDLARFSEMMRLGGKFNGQQIVPKSVIADIRGGASQQDFAKAGYELLPNWSYRDMWWVSHDTHGVYSARGLHGQSMYIDPKAKMVIVRYASHPLARSLNFDPTTLPAYRAVANHLMANSL